MKAEVICVGTELLMGQILNTNAQYLAQKLNELGYNHYFQTVVGDNKNRIKQAIKLAEQRSDLLILTGGLGPTPDDQTKEVLADYLEEDLVINQPALESIYRSLHRSGRTVGRCHHKMALQFKKGLAFQNPQGQALATAIEKNKKLYICLPGPARELQAIFESSLQTYLENEKDHRLYIHSRYLNYFGIAESDLAQRLNTLLVEQDNPSLAIYSNGQTLELRLTASSSKEETNHALLDQLENEIHQQVGQWFYGRGHNLSPAQALVEALKNHKQSLALAESLTGGLAASQLVDLDGVSQIFKGGIVSYSQQAKEEVLGVDKELVEKEGMVSAGCAQQMAEKALDQFKSHWAISWTGVAGPDKMEDQAVGTVYIGLSQQGQVSRVKKIKCQGQRQSIRQQAVNTAFIQLLKILEGEEVDWDR